MIGKGETRGLDIRLVVEPGALSQKTCHRKQRLYDLRNPRKIG